MKKSAFLVIILIVAVAILATICLFNQEAMSNSVKLSVYTYAQSNQTIKPELTLKENKQFDFSMRLKVHIRLMEHTKLRIRGSILKHLTKNMCLCSL